MVWESDYIKIILNGIFDQQNVIKFYTLHMPIQICKMNLLVFGYEVIN